MAINLNLDLIGNPEPPTIILANRNGNKLGQLKVNDDSISLNDKFNDVSEISFTVNKYIDGKITPLWNQIVDFKLIYCKEWDLWFELKVELDEETESVKTAFGTQLGQAELSQTMLYNIEINTEKDIERDDYKISILYDSSDTDASILDRVLKKAPHYSIAHVDSTIANIQRTFSFNETSIHDAFKDISEEIGCLFVYNSNSNTDGTIKRTISVYDLQQNCLNPNCRHRGDFTDKCPKCESTNIKYGYGEDTTIFVTSDELASGGIHLTTDTDSVKNCFKLEAGDDLLTATIRNCNPNGSNYIWRFSDMIKDDMSDELVDKIESYDGVYQEYYNNYESNIDTTLLNKYNKLVTKYSANKNDLQSINNPIIGYPNLMNTYYNTIDLALYLKSGLMPSVEMSGTDAKRQAALLTADNISTVAVNTEKISSVSLATANSAVLSMAKIIVRSTYKVEINASSISSDKKTWTGNFVVTNYSDEEDTATSSTISITINNDSETFIKQKIEKVLNKENTNDYSISGLFSKTGTDFTDELKKYALNPLKSFYDACDACIDILIDQGAGNKDKKPDLYTSLYQPYYQKSTAISEEIKLRESEIAIIEGVWDNTDENNPKLKTKGLQYYIEKCRDTIQNSLDFEKYLGEKLCLEFASYRREDTYSNSNYVSDGLNNAELFDKALEFIEVAENEIYKASELQYSISTNLNNLLTIDKFKPLVNSFKLGNWIRVQVNDEIYKLRLISYEIDFNSLENISVDFSDITKIKNGISDLESVLSQASSIASSYTATKRQAKQGDSAKGTVDQWLENGLNSALIRIKSNNNEEVTLNKNGLLCRSYDDITDTYLPEQFRLTHNIMAYTTDNWQTVSAALGKHDYIYYDSKKIRQTGTAYGLSAEFVTAGNINGSQIIGGEIYSDNYTSTTGTYINLRDGTFSWAGGKFTYDGSKIKISGDGSGLDISSNDSITGLSSRITQTAAQIRLEVNDTANGLSSKIEQTAAQIRLEVNDTANGLSSKIEQTAESIISTVSETYETKTDANTKKTQLKSQIEQTAENITSTVSATYETKTDANTKKTQLKSQIEQTAENITSTVSATYETKTDAGTKKSQLESKIKQNATNIELKVSKDSVISTINQSAESIAINANKISLNGKTINLTSDNIAISSTNFSVTKDGKMTAKSGEIAGNLEISGSLTHSSGNYTVTLRGVQSNTSYGVFYITDKSSGSNVYPFIVNGDGSFKATKATISGNSTFGGTLSAVSGTFTSLSAGASSFSKNVVIIDADGQSAVRIGTPNYTDSNGKVWKHITIRPNISAGADPVGNIGTPNHLWDLVYSKAGSISSSDRNKKKDILSMGEIQEKLFNELIPVTYKFADGSSHRIHYGFVSQDVEDAMLKVGLTGEDFAGFCKDSYLNDEGQTVDSYGLRYTEFIALNTHMIQKLQAENQKLNERIDLLESKLK